MNNTVWSCMLIFFSIITISLAIYAARRRKVPGALEFSLVLAAMAFHSMGYSFELLSGTVEKMYRCIRVEYIGISFYPFFIMLFARKYAEERRLANNYVMGIILLLNIATFILVTTNSHHSLYYSSLEVDSTLGLNVLKFEKGVWYHVHEVAVLLANIYAIAVFGIRYVRLKSEYRTRAIFMLWGSIFPMVVFVLYILGFWPAHIDPMPFAYTIMSVLIGVGIFKYKILSLNPITYDMVFNAIDEAVLVADENGFLVSFNNAAKSIFPSMKNLMVGEHVGAVNELEKYDFKSSVEEYKIGEAVYSIKAIEIKNCNGIIYVINDITESHRVKSQLETMARTDHLTGICNRRHFMESFSKDKVQGVFAILDIDHFKKINDTFGHLRGDEVLIRFANELEKSFENAMVCRYGGEEFAIRMDNCSLNEAFSRIDAFKRKIAGSEIGITFSAGISEYEKGEVSRAIAQADGKLYEAKGSGRNTIIV